NQHLWQYTRQFTQAPWMRTDHEASLVSGLLLPRVFADALNEKAAKLLALHKADPGQVKYLTYNSSFVPIMTGLFEPAPERSLWAHIPGDAAFAPMMDEILAKQPAMILIDAPSGPLAVTGARKAFQDRVRRAVSRDYDLTETDAGWQIWRLRSAGRPAG